MRRPLFIALVCGVLLCGCAPALIRYKHVVVVESAALKVMERSTESNDSQGKPLSGRKIGLPTKSVLTRSLYAVTIFTPVNPTPVVFLKAADQNRQELNLRGMYLSQIEKKSGMGLQRYRYSFSVDAAAGASLEFDVVTEQGVVLGRERIQYDVVSRGYVWAIDAI